jgi:glycosyltransferase involved in cell wall biosynthesis
MTATETPTVAILLPVYNGEKYLAVCLESILAQSWRDWELIIVNNCSTDRSLEIASSYAARDPRIRISNNLEFLSAIENHNNALRHLPAWSKYCKLVFADDWLYPDCIRLMVEHCDANPSVSVVSSYGLRNSSVLWTGLPYPSSVVNGRDICRERLLGGPYVFGTGTSHMFRADEVRRRDSFYNVKNLHCDSEVFFQILQTGDFGFIHQILHYTRAPEAESYTTYAFKRRTLEAMVLYEFLTYGPVFLTSEEYARERKRRFKEYYAFLAQSILTGGASWEFHRTKLREFGLQPSRTRLAAEVLKKALRAVFQHPLRTYLQVAQGKSVISYRIGPRSD